MTAFRVEYGRKEDAERGALEGFRTWEPSPERRYYVDDAEVDLHAFLVAIEYEDQMLGNVMVETRVYGPVEAIDWDTP